MVTSNFRTEVEIGHFAHAQWKICNIALIYGRIAEIFASFRKSRRGTRWWRQNLDRKWKYGHFAHAQLKICNITLIKCRIAHIFASFRKSGSRNTIVTSDFLPEVEIRPFRACAMKNMQYNPYLWPNRRNFRVPKISGSRNTIVTSDLRAVVEIWPFRACVMHCIRPVRIRGTVRSLWTWLWGRYHVPQNVFLVLKWNNSR